MIPVFQVSETEYVVDNTAVTIWRDNDGAVRTNPVIVNEKLQALKDFLEAIYNKNRTAKPTVDTG